MSKTILNKATLNKFSALAFAMGILAFVNNSLMAAPLDKNIVENRLEAVPQATASFQGKQQAKVFAGDNISLSRRTKNKVIRKNLNSLKLAVDGKTDVTNAKKRPKLPQLSSKAFGFSIFDASTFLNFDGDGDGYYSDFTVEFDADYDNGTAEVYAKIYTSQNGGDWEELFITDVFVISFDATDDFQSITTALNFGFPTGNYDILIDLYENGISGIVASLEPSTDGDLFALPLEDQEHERTSNASSISFVASTLSKDFDGDGFYTELSLEYDIETPYSGDIVYAEIVVIDTFDGSRQFLSSDHFELGSQTEIIDLTFNAGYPSGWYDIQINLINVFTDEVIANAAQEFSSLKSLPIESIEKDNTVSSFEPEVDVVIHAGSFGLGVILFGFMGLISRRRGQR